MATILEEQPRVKGTVHYLKDLALYHTEKPYYYSSHLPPGQDHLRTNITREPRTVEFIDLRGREDVFSLDDHGFAFAKSPPGVKPGDLEEQEARDTYLRSLSAMVKDSTNSEIVVCYDYTVRIKSFACVQCISS